MLLRLATLSLLLLYPVAWVAPLMRAGVLPLFGLSEISVFTGLRALWSSDIFLAIVVALFAIAAPYVKLLGLVAVQWNRAPRRLLRVVHGLSRLAMADVFLIALYIVLAKGTGIGRVEVAWGLYLFTALILASMVCGWLTERGEA